MKDRFTSIIYHTYNPGVHKTLQAHAPSLSEHQAGYDTAWMAPGVNPSSGPYAQAAQDCVWDPIVGPSKKADLTALELVHASMRLLGTACSFFCFMRTYSFCFKKFFGVTVLLCNWSRKPVSIPTELWALLMEFTKDNSFRLPAILSNPTSVDVMQNATHKCFL
jgi:hypothetical protein